MLAAHTPPARSAFAIERQAATDHHSAALACTLDYIAALAGAVRLTLDELHGEYSDARECLNLATSMLNLIGDQAAAATSVLTMETVQ